MLPVAVAPPAYAQATPPTAHTREGERGICTAYSEHELDEWDDAGAAQPLYTAAQGVLATPLQRAAPSRWARAATTATEGATSLPGAAFRESATLRASFWLCRGCDLAWPLTGAHVCAACHIAREDMQLQAGATEVAQVHTLVQASSYGRSLHFANSTEQPIGAPPAAFANPHAPGFAEMVRSTAVRLLGPGATLNGAKTDALTTFESWLLLTYDAEFSVYACLREPNTRAPCDSHHPYSYLT
jgi:hypothetical protein